MAKRRGYPDRRGMGAESDFIAELFMPSEHYKTQQMAMAQELIAGGMNPEQVASMFPVPADLPADAEQKDEEPNDL